MLKTNKLLRLHFIVFLWGLTPVLGKLISLQALDLVWWRLILASLSLYVFVLYRKYKFDIRLKEVFELLFMGLIVGLHWFFFYHAIKVSNVSIAMAGFSTMTLFASFMQPLLLKKKFFWGDAFYGILIFIGLAIILSFDSGAFLGVIYGVLAALTGAFFGTYNGKLITKHNSSVITLVEFIGALIIITLVKFFMQSESFFPALSMEDFVWLLILSVLCTTVAFTMSVEIMKYFTPFTVIITNNLEPIYGVVFSLLLFGQSEIMNSQFYIGALIILICVFTYPGFKRKFDKN
ncbi:MAG: DMT family transporter [Bacteroidota bacterium]